MPTPVLPNAKVAARTALLAQPTLTALVANRIYYAIPSDPPPTYPLLVLSVVDDDELRPETLTARVQVDVWGTGKNVAEVLECEAVAAVVRSVARDLRGTWGAASISNSVAGQIIPNPDATSGRARNVVDLLLEIN